VRLTLGLAALACVACSSTPGFDYDASVSPYDALPPAELASLREARALADRGSFDAALAILGEVFARQPRNIAIGAYLQDVQLAALRARADASQGGGGDSTGDEDAVVRDRARRWRERAEERRTPTNLVLAARVEEDVPAARLLLEEALEIDDRCAWAHYGLAHHDARADRWESAAAHLERALAVDPAHLPSRRLEAAMLVRSGEPEVALRALDSWLARARDHPLVPARHVGSAWFDRAHVAMELDEPDDAWAALERIDGDDWQAGARQALLAAIEFARERPSQALRAAERAAELDAQSVVPLVQQALLHDVRGGDPIASKRAWERVRATVAEADDSALKAMIWAMRALVEIERLEARLPPSPIGIEELDALEGGE